jgi:branched-chain amino acid transport system permease protein
MTLSSANEPQQQPAPKCVPAAAAASGWWDTLKSNVPIPFILLAVWGLSFLVEGGAISSYYQRIVMLIGFSIILAVSLQLINGFSGQFSLGHAGFMMVGAYMAAYPAVNLSEGMTNPTACAWFFVTVGVLAGVVGMMLLLLFWGLRATRKLHSTVPAILLILLIAWLLIDLSKANGYSLPPSHFVWTKLFSSIASGFDWMLVHGQPAALKISSALPAAMQSPVCFLVLVIGGGCCAGVVGLVVGMPALRLRGDYLAIATLGMAEIIRILIQNSQPLGGALGITGIPKFTSFTWLYGFVVITIVVIWRVAYSAKGRAIMAVREDEIAASACGIDTTHHKVMAFIIGAFFGGIAGALYAMFDRIVTPSYFGLQKSIEIVVMVTLGGLGSISGAVLAAIVLSVLLELLRDPRSIGIWGWLIIFACAIAMTVWSLKAKDRRWMLWVAWILALCGLWELGVMLARRFNVQLSDFRMIIYSLALIFMMLLRPRGLLGGIELWPGRGRTKRLAVATEDRDDRLETT